MTKVDLKDAYFMVPIHKKDIPFLKFLFKERTYQFKRLPFGLACASWVFTKILKPLACLHLLEGNQITARKLSQFLGRLQAATRAVPLAPLFYRKLQRALQGTLEQSDQDYSAQLILSTGEQEELQ